jgi:hypothetical protein
LTAMRWDDLLGFGRDPRALGARLAAPPAVL